jgi:uncharacterized protein (TIGR02246 family)
MRTTRFLAALGLVISSACAAPAPEPSAAPMVDAAALKDTIQAREREWSAAFLAGDAAAVSALYTEDAASIPARGDWHRGRAAIGQDLQATQFDSLTFTAREDITDEVIPVGTDYAWEVGHYSSTGTYKTGGKTKTASGRYVVLWKRDTDGVWRLHRDMGTEAPPTP